MIEQKVSYRILDTLDMRHQYYAQYEKLYERQSSYTNNSNIAPKVSDKV